MGYDIISGIIIGVVTGIISSILIVRYTQSENNRNTMNHNIELLATEINWNRNKLKIYSEEFQEIKRQWEEEKILSRIDKQSDMEISKGYGENIYNLFLFDSYNYFISEGIHLDVNLGLDYSIKQFYHNCMQFCLNIQQNEDKIQEYYGLNQNGLINLEFEKIENEINEMSRNFGIHTFAPSPGSEYRRENKIGWIDWHIKQNRRVIYLFKNNPPY
jgi:hypothetical protein